MNLVAYDGTDVLVRRTVGSRYGRLFERLDIFDGREQSVVISLTVEVQVSPFVVKIAE
ncbi:MAG: hypothetical protein V5A27_00720 [Halapricum sp.]